MVGITIPSFLLGLGGCYNPDPLASFPSDASTSDSAAESGKEPASSEDDGNVETTTSNEAPSTNDDRSSDAEPSESMQESSDSKDPNDESTKETEAESSGGTSSEETSETEADLGGEDTESTSEESESDTGTDTNGIECVDPIEDCPVPTNRCRESYCDETDQCAEQPANEGDTVETGDWGECVSEDDGSGKCVEKRHRANIICEDGEEISKDQAEPCARSPKDKKSCGVCGNGFVEDGEVCEPLDGFCQYDCQTHIVYVDANEKGNGSSWIQATPDFQQGLDVAGEFAKSGKPVEVWVANASYSPSSKDGFVLPAGVEIYGGFDGLETLRSQRENDPDKNSTVLDGEGTAFHVVQFIDTGAASRIDGFTIRGGNANGGSTSETRGGGLYIWPEPEDGTSELALKNVNISSNSANTAGGGFYVRFGTILLLGNVTLEENGNDKTLSNGGGFYVSASSSLVRISGDVELKNNVAGGYGGGVNCSYNGGLSGGKIEVLGGATLRLASNHVGTPDNNEVNGWGGGFSIAGSCLFSVSGIGSRLEIQNNTAKRAGAGFHNNGELAMVRVTDGAVMKISGNIAQQSNGGGFVTKGTVRVDRAEAIVGSGNQAPNGAGAGFLKQSSGKLETSPSFFDNEALSADP